ncbi:hypothetical protein [Halonotius sp. GCM10025705]|uniref:hypothetical protein n=1 Tax=Halonotius sp. GCM10025705 TaxID=3252678 RepID=UPI0036086157
MLEVILADFREITCSGGQIDFSNVYIGDDARFDLATFSGERAVFEDVEVSGNLSFAEAEFNIRDSKFAGINTTGEQIEFKHVKLPKGKFEIKFFDTVYNLEEAVIGDIKMDSDEFDNDKQKNLYSTTLFSKKQNLTGSISINRE